MIDKMDHASKSIELEKLSKINIVKVNKPNQKPNLCIA